MSENRGRFYVDRTVQGALARRIVFHWFVFFLLSLVSLLAIEYFTGDPNLTFGGHLGVMWGKYGFFVLLMLAIVPSFVYDSLKLSNRFAGPMVRLREGIRQLADGEDGKDIKFRDGDFWGDVANEFNRMRKRFGSGTQEQASKTA